MEKSKEQMCELILNLLNKTEENGCTPEEAEAFKNKAYKLMAKHQIDLLRVMDKTRKKNGDIDIDYMQVSRFNNGAWEKLLGMYVADCFDCKTVSIMEQRYGNKEFFTEFIGHTQDLEMVNFFFSYLRRYGLFKSQEFSNLKREQIGFLESYVYAVKGRLEEMYKRIEEDFDTNCTALMVVKKGSVEKFQKDRYPNLKTKRINYSKASAGSQRAGTECGKKTPLGRPITHNQNTQSSIGG